jgi:hypothetical protein
LLSGGSSRHTMILHRADVICREARGHGVHVSPTSDSWPTPQAQLLVLFRTCRSRWRSGDNVASLRALLGLALILGPKSRCYAVLCK